MDDLIAALQIFRKYGNFKYPTYCGIDVLYVSIDFHYVTEEDRIRLYELGFFIDLDRGHFASYRFGSI